MERAAYERMGESEADHWWFVGRRAVLDRIIRDHASVPPSARVLEAGCGTGGNLAMLAQFGSVDAIEFDAQARELAAAKGLADVVGGSLPDHVDLPDGTYDLVALLDVLEHIEDDVATLQTLGRKLTPGGRMVISVPAVPWLWSRHDELHHHLRRYTARGLRHVIESAGLDVCRIGHFNTVLFPVAVVQRLVHKLTGSQAELDSMPSPWLNRALAATFGAERHVVGRVSMPVGLSLFAVVMQPVP